jgi:DNA-binding CsgD family transcriptional regulator
MLWQNHGSASSFNREVVKLTMENVWGRFLYQTELMAALVTGGGQVILVNIEHQEPIAINLRRVVGEPMLSPAQGEVLLLSFTGHSTAEIATTLEIAPSTVADHIKNIYARLDVHSMRELSAQINQQMLRREH